MAAHQVIEKQPLLKTEGQVTIEFDKYRDEGQVIVEFDEYGNEILFRGEYCKRGMGGVNFNYVILAVTLICTVLFIPFLLLIPTCYRAHKKRWTIHLTKKGIYFVTPLMDFPWCTDKKEFIRLSDIRSITREGGGSWLKVVIGHKDQTIWNCIWYDNMVIRLGPIKNSRQFIAAVQNEKQRQGLLGNTLKETAI